MFGMVTDPSRKRSEKRGMVFRRAFNPSFRSGRNRSGPAKAVGIAWLTSVGLECTLSGSCPSLLGASITESCMHKKYVVSDDICDP